MTINFTGKALLGKPVFHRCRRLLGLSHRRFGPHNLPRWNVWSHLNLVNQPCFICQTMWLVSLFHAFSDPYNCEISRFGKLLWDVIVHLIGLLQISSATESLNHPEKWWNTGLLLQYYRPRNRHIRKWSWFWENFIFLARTTVSDILVIILVCSTVFFALKMYPFDVRVDHS